MRKICWCPNEIRSSCDYNCGPRQVPRSFALRFKTSARIYTIHKHNISAYLEEGLVKTRTTILEGIPCNVFSCLRRLPGEAKQSLRSDAVYAVQMRYAPAPSIWECIDRTGNKRCGFDDAWNMFQTGSGHVSRLDGASRIETTTLDPYLARASAINNLGEVR